MEAEVVVARLLASGVTAILGPPGEPYGSLSFAVGVAILVPARDAPRALALMERFDSTDQR
ncbi:MAG: hypothetical protein ACRDWE_02480 [Acidimicrobiales bacterium]